MKLTQADSFTSRNLCLPDNKVSIAHHETDNTHNIFTCAALKQAVQQQLPNLRFQAKVVVMDLPRGHTADRDGDSRKVTYRNTHLEEASSARVAVYVDL